MGLSEPSLGKGDHGARLLLEALDLLGEQSPGLSGSDLALEPGETFPEVVETCHHHSNDADDSTSGHHRGRTTGEDEIYPLADGKKYPPSKCQQNRNDQTTDCHADTLADVLRCFGFRKIRYRFVDAHHCGIGLLGCLGHRGRRLVNTIFSQTAKRPGEHEEEAPEHRAAILQAVDVLRLLPVGHAPGQDLCDVPIFLKTNIHLEFPLVVEFLLSILYMFFKKSQ